PAEADPAMVRQLPAPPPGSDEPIRPHIVRTVSIRPAAPGAGRQFVVTETLPALASAPAAVGSAQAAAVPVAPAPAPSAVAAEARVAALRGEWVIQIGAFPAEEQAHSRLQAARSVAGKILAGAEPFTESVTRGDATLFRARFAGF